MKQKLDAKALKRAQAQLRADHRIRQLQHEPRLSVADERISQMRHSAETVTLHALSCSRR